MSDILASIDALLADVQQCACGCSEQVTAQTASPFFASQDCQARWMAAQGEPLPADAADDYSWVNTPPAVRTRMEQAEIGSLLQQFPLRQAAEPVREPVTEKRRAGCRLMLFVGGPWHQDVRAVPESPFNLCVPWPPVCSVLDFRDPSAVFELPAPAVYTRRTMVGQFEGRQHSLSVYVCGQVSDADLQETLVARRDLLAQLW